MILEFLLAAQAAAQVAVVAGAAFLMVYERFRCPFLDTYFLVVFMILLRRVSAYVCTTGEPSLQMLYVNNIWIPMTISALLVLLTVQMGVHFYRPRGAANAA